MNNDVYSKRIFAHGLSQLVTGYNSQNVKLDNINPNMLEEHLPYYDANTLAAVSDHFTKKYPDRMTGESWMKRFEQIAKEIDYPELKQFTGASHYNINARLAGLYFDAIDSLIKAGRLEMNWVEVFDNFKDKIELSKYIGITLVPIICSRTFREDPESAKSFMYNVDFKKLKAPVRTAYYQAYIKAGLLDKKIARRIRSDGAEKTSRDAIETFIQCADLYDNPKSLMTQFTDIKHRDAQYIMAKKAPDYMVPFMMGFDCPYAKNILEKRAMEITKAKEKKESSNG
jgi:hypothetical protein